MRFVLATTVRKLQFELDAPTTTTPIEVHVSYNQWYAKDILSEGSQNTTISTATITDICDAPLSAMPKEVEMINIYNPDTADHLITLYYYDNGTRYIIWRGTVKSGSTYTQSATGAGMVVDSTGSAQWSTGTATTPGDPDTDLLFHFNSDKYNTTGVYTFDGSSGVIDNTTYLFGGGSMYVPDTGDKITEITPAYTNFNTFKTGSWTFEYFHRGPSAINDREITVRCLSVSGGSVYPILYRAIIQYNTATTVNIIVTLELRNEAGTLLGNSGTGGASFITNQPSNWYHFAITYDASTDRYSHFFNGVRYSFYLDTSIIMDITNIEITNSGVGNGYIDDFRISKISRYNTATYTIPTTELT
jgi:hypothetical protein